MLEKKFEIIRYANCWEDTEILLKALSIKKSGKYLSIISGGDNTLSLLTEDPDLVVGVDISPAQIALFHLKIAAFKNLSHDNVLKFFGIVESDERIEIYNTIKRDMPEGAQIYWDNHPGIIKKGIIFAGKFERYFAIFRRYILPLIHRRKTIEKLFALNTRKERLEFFKRNWNNFFWKLIFRIFFSKFLMGHLGRDPEFFRYVNEPVAVNIKWRVDRGIINVPASDNPYVDFILHGNFKVCLPYYLRKKNFQKIKDRLDRIKIVQGPVEKALILRYDGFNLSDIFEYMDYNSFKNIYGQILRSAKKGARIVYRNMLAPRESPPEYKKFVVSHVGIAREFLKRDRAFFYSRIVIEEKL